jgi:preprotein translocase subunit SecE
MQKALKAIQDYFKGSVAEMKKVVWPNKKQTRDYTIVVVLMSIGVAVFFGVLDYVFNIGLEIIIR